MSHFRIILKQLGTNRNSWDRSDNKSTLSYSANFHRIIIKWFGTRNPQTRFPYFMPSETNA